MSTGLRDIIVVGASAGGVTALLNLVRDLPPNLSAAILIVQHRASHPDALLADLLDRAGPLSARDAIDGEAIQRGRIYVAPADRHLLVEGNVLRVTRGPKENFCRPAIDPLFRAAAREYGSRVIGVILSGTLYDGTAGLATVKQEGGFAIVQNPQDAAFPEMPERAIAGVPVDCVLTLEEIAPALVKMTAGSSETESDAAGTGDAAGDAGSGGESRMTMAPSDSDRLDKTEFDRLPEAMEADQREQKEGRREGRQSVFTCPDCGGSLWQANVDSQIQFRCHVGHAFSAENLAMQQDDAMERAIWFAIRTLVDRSILLRQLSENALLHRNAASAQRFEDEAQTAERHAETLRRIIEAAEPKAENISIP